MNKTDAFDKMVSKKVFKKCIDKGYEKYSEVAILLGTSESFAKAIFSSNRKKLNLYHLVKLTYELDCDIKDFLPDINDYLKQYENISTEAEGFYKSIEGGK